MNRKWILIWFLGFILIFSSCTDDVKSNDIEDEDKSVEILFRVRTSPSTYAMNNIKEGHIETIDVLAFKIGEDSKAYFAYNEKGTEIRNVSDNEKEFTIKVKKDLNNRYQFVVLANAREEVEHLGMISITATKEDLQRLIISKNQDKWDVSDNFKPFPMWGESNQLIVNDNVSISDIILLRAIARVDISVSSSAQDKFILDSVFVYNRKTRGYVIPAAYNWNEISKAVTSATVPPDYSSVDPLTIRGPLRYESITDSTARQLIYLYEAEGVPSENDLDATCIVVGGYYNNDTDPTYYRIDFKKNSADFFDDILRNHWLDVVIMSVSSSGEKTPDEAFENVRKEMEVSVTTWNLSYMEIIIKGSYYLNISQSYFDLARTSYKGIITIETNHPSGWDYIFTPDPSSWLTIQRSGNNLIFNVQSLSSGQRQAYIEIVAGNLHTNILINQTGPGSS